jgi:hypothetical protein
VEDTRRLANSGEVCNMVKMRYDERYEIQRESCDLVGERVLCRRILRDVDVVEEVRIEGSHGSAGCRMSSGLRASHSDKGSSPFS